MHMPIPRQLREQQDAINEHYKRLESSDDNPGEGQNDPPPDADASQTGSEGADEPATDSGAHEPPTPQQSADKESGSDPRHEDPAYWRHRHDVMQGMVDKANREAQDMRQQLAERDRRIEELKGQLESRQPEQDDRRSGRDMADAMDSAQSLDQLKEEYGPEIVDAVRRIAQTEGFVSQQQVDQRFEQDREKQRQQQAATGFRDALLQRVPDALEINSDPLWLAWLNERAPMSTRTRQQNLTEAQQAGDVDTVVQLFEAYKAHDRSRQGGGTAGGQAGEQGQSRTQLPPESVQPRSSRREDPPQESARVTTADVQQFYRDVAHGRYRNRPDERKAFEQKIFDAHRSGDLV